MSTPRYKKPHINKFHPQLVSVSDITDWCGGEAINQSW